MKNALSIDLEFWYSAELVNPYRQDSNDLIIEMTEPILNLLDSHNTKATFFVLGEVAEKYPELIKEIYDKGHEIASHSYSHRTLYELGKEEFREEIKKSVSILKKITGENVKGFRAPTFSINNETKWALNILENFGFKYDSSIFPMRTNLYGVPNAPLCPYRPSFEDLSKENQYNEYKILEIPLTIYKFRFIKIPVAGGFYLRALPLKLFTEIIKNINKNNFSILYVHPWELFPFAPRVNLPLASKIITYYHIEQSLYKLECLLNTFNYSSIEDICDEI